MVVTCIRFWVRVPVLSVQTTEVEPEGLHRGQPLDEGAAACHLAYADREREGDRGQQSFRYVGHQQPDRETAGGRDQGLGFAAGAGGAAEYHVGSLQQRHAQVGRASRASISRRVPSRSTLACSGRNAASQYAGHGQQHASG
jgi:hypothetical protein